MAGAFDFAAAIALLPFASFVVAILAGYFTPRLLPKGGAIPGILATLGSLLVSVWLLVTVSGTEQYYNEEIYTWTTGLAGETFDLSFGLLLDPLSSYMLVIVALISFLVHVFSLGYMNDEGEIGLPRYYAGLGLFSFSMLAFVMASNILMAFMFFELVGLCSWLLIGFWFRQEGPPSAAKKAFLVTRFGDYFFLIGVVAIFATFGTGLFAPRGDELGFPQLATEALSGEMPAVVSNFLGTIGMEPQTWFAIIGLLVLGGVIGKSAQFPLHTWLPDAMEGPTPVSALIHAATMVAAGVYLVMRMYGFYAQLPTVLALIALVGGFTALMAATMAIVKREIKQVLAYSTISQYGYMMLALGAGGYVAATFHLMTHAFFKALLFLGAGSVIIAMHHNENMWDMGGLRKRMPVTYYTFLSGSLALAGIFPFAGFWSKDEILYEALIHGLGGQPLILLAYAFGLVAVFFTGFYTFRMVILTFHGEARSETAEDPHPVRWNVKFPLVVLGILAAVMGLVNMAPVKELTGWDITYLHHWFETGLPQVSLHEYHHLLESAAGYHAVDLAPFLPAALSLGLALAGALLAMVLYRGPAPTAHTDKLGSIKTLLYNNYYQDEYQVWLAEGLTLPLARVADKFDQGIIDGVVNGISSVALFGGSRIRRLQTGRVTNYAALLTLGLVVLVVAIALVGGWF
ncbi:NADH-quinone oxidoreductase subunit L [Halodesulfurarchaeum formicicum]|uniref:NADH-quinone oxidoreductase subunit L n=1 Tax=Halodesulfurarchaeum formicicum TaxID=1873524 RepID=A0A1D8S4S1_9EURY|nr:NADH-quinone oxidoreductase subunit L [Halodesulfurarchaeum formicicum]AOW80353.1 NADH-quinone oxidoreductase subunit L [Halodesulfurarchaeum formicicum]APE95656.1 NADH-quinone oxidoreductase subunit L [Halodesulfurarchaeum formicicum]